MGICNVTTADDAVRGDADGWSPLEFYAFAVRTCGVPARFALVDGVWIAEAPFTRPAPASVLALLRSHGV